MSSSKRHRSAPRHLGWAFVLVAACVPATELQPPPTEPDANAMILAFVRDGAKPIVFGADVEHGRVIFPELVLRERGTYEIYALYYPCPLEAIGLSSGRIDPDLLKMPRPFRSWRSVVSGSEQTDWGSVEALPPSLGEKLVSRCALFLQEHVHVPTVVTTLLIGMDEHSAIVATPSGEFLLVREDTIVEQLSAEPSTPFTSAFRASDGEIWLFGPEGLLSHGNFFGSFSSEPPSPRPAAVRFSWLDGSNGGRDVELFALSSGGSFDRFDGKTSSWTGIANGGRLLESYSAGGVVSLRPGEALAFGADTPEMPGLSHYRDGRVTLERPPSYETGAQARALAFVPGLGAIVGTNKGAVEAFDGDQWSAIEALGDVTPIQSLLAFRDGFIMGAAGVVLQHVPLEPLCAQQLPTATVFRMAPLPGGDFVMLRYDTTYALDFVSSTEPYPECDALPRAR